MDRNPRFLIWRKVDCRLDNYTWFTRGCRFDMVSEFLDYDLELTSDKLSLTVTEDEEKAFNREMVDILRKQFKVDALVRANASTLSPKYCYRVDCNPNYIGSTRATICTTEV